MLIAISFILQRTPLPHHMGLSTNHRATTLQTPEKCLLVRFLGISKRMLLISVCACARRCAAHVGAHNACGGAGGCARASVRRHMGAVLVLPPEGSLRKLPFSRPFLVSQLCCLTRASLLAALFLRPAARVNKCSASRELLAMQGSCKALSARPVLG